jgi:hypothetical protein
LLFPDFMLFCSIFRLKNSLWVIWVPKCPKHVKQIHPNVGGFKYVFADVSLFNYTPWRYLGSFFVRWSWVIGFCGFPSLYCGDHLSKWWGR